MRKGIGDGENVEFAELNVVIELLGSYALVKICPSADILMGINNESMANCGYFWFRDRIGEHSELREPLETQFQSRLEGFIGPSPQ